MKSGLGWALAVALAGLASLAYGWRGALLAATLIVFWLLLQFSQAARVMRRAAMSPVGTVDSAVMLHARMARGMTMLQIVAAARSLGRKTGDAPETWTWSDAGGATLTVQMSGARVQRWALTRTGPG